jgi:glycosyltransferase involved in cell wall biosynthesis
MKPIRVLQVLCRADRGGAETWLVHVAQHIDRQKVAMDFLVHDDAPGAYDAQIKAGGARLFPATRHRNVFRQWYYLRKYQRRYGPFDIIHSHVDYYGGLVVLLAYLSGISVRIAHSHNDTREIAKAAGIGRRFYIHAMKRCVHWFATYGLGTSAAAASALFGENWRNDARWRIHLASVDLQRFHECHKRETIRAELGLPRDAVVFGHVGRLVEQKNHDFLLRVAAILAVRDQRVHFLLVGSGPRRAQIEARVRELGLEDRVVILSSRDDTPRLMLGAMDYFLFPSQHEGLGLALVEAQAAGLQCFISDSIPSEALVVPELIRQLSLSLGPESWAETILRYMKIPSSVTPQTALKTVEDKFDIARNAEQLVEFYQAAAS